jgi:hypothetical protein
MRNRGLERHSFARRITTHGDAVAVDFSGVNLSLVGLYNPRGHASMKAWRAETMYSSDTDFIFPSIKLGGRQQRTRGILATDYIHPAAVAADILELRDGVRYCSVTPVNRGCATS